MHNIFSKVVSIILIALIIYLWNCFVVEFMVSAISNYYKKYNADNLDKQPFKFFIENESGVKKAFRIFYWFGFAVISIGIFISD